MALAFDVAASSPTSTFGVTSVATGTFTIAATANRGAVLFLSQAGNGATSITSACSGVSGSAISGTDSTTSRTPRSLMHKVINPGSGASKTASFSWTGSQDAIMGALIYNGADQTNFASNGTTTNGATGAPSVTVSAGASGDLSVVGLNATFTPGGATQTTRITNQDNGSTVLTVTEGPSGATHAWNDGFLPYTTSGCNVIAVPPSVAITGTATASITEADIVAGGKTVIATVTNDTFAPAVGTVAYSTGTAKSTTTAPGRTGNGDLTCSFPPGYTPVAGDYSVIILYSDQGSGSTPTGYSQITGSPFGAGTEKLQIFVKTLAGGESDPVSTISGSGANISHCANMAIYKQCTLGAIGTASNGTGTPMTAGAIVTTANNSYVLGCCGRGDNENSSAQSFGGSTTGVTERLDGGTDQGNDSQVSMYDKAFPTSGTSSGNGSATTSATDPWVSVLIELVPNAPFDNSRQSIINGMVSAQSEANGWNNTVTPAIAVTDVVRTSNTVCTVTLPAVASYNITAQETITVTIPALALAGGAAVVGSPTFTIDPSGGGGFKAGWAYGATKTIGGVF